MRGEGDATAKRMRRKIEGELRVKRESCLTSLGAKYDTNGAGRGVQSFCHGCQSITTKDTKAHKEFLFELLLGAGLSVRVGSTSTSVVKILD